MHKQTFKIRTETTTLIIAPELLLPGFINGSVVADTLPAISA